MPNMMKNVKGNIINIEQSNLFSSKRKNTLYLHIHENFLFTGSKSVSLTVLEPFSLIVFWIDHCGAKWAPDKSSDYSLMFVHRGSVCLGF